MEASFQFLTVDRLLADTVASDLESGRSVVVLGGIGSGKYILRSRVIETLKQNKAEPLVEVNFEQEPPWTKVDDVRRLVAEAAIAAGAIPVDDGQSLLGSLDGFNRCAYLLLSNVSSLGHLLVRQLLEELRSRVERSEATGKVVVLLAGEYDLRDYVHGPASEVTSFARRHYVLQGCDFECFDHFLQNHFTYSAIPLPEESSRRILWKMTGGDADLARKIIGAVLTARQMTGIKPSDVTIDGKVIQEVLKNGARYGLSDVLLLRHALRLVPLDPEVWSILQKLVRRGPFTLRFAEARPAALTLSGLARRQNGRLVFSSPVVGEAARRLFGSRFFGDLYAQTGKWSKAFYFYKLLGPEDKLRPVHGGDRRPAINTIRAAMLSFDNRVLEGSVPVREFFEKICRHVLGFSEIFIWQKRNKWELIFPSSSTLSAGADKAARETLKLADSVRSGKEVPVPNPWTGAGFAWKFEGSAEKRDMVGFVGDFDERRLVSPERERLLKELAHAFLKAHREATEKEALRRTREFFRIQNAILSDVLRELGVKIFDVEDALKKSAPQLRALDYQRIGFALVNPTGDRIARVVDEVNTPGIPGKSWLLSEPGSGVHPFVVASGLPLYVDDTAEHPLTDKEMCRRADIRAFAVVPILASDQTVVGTINVERADHVVPSKKEVEDFIAFGQILHSLMEHAQRVALLQRSLDLTPEPLVIVDARHNLRYLNHRAAILLGIDSEWRPTHQEAVSEKAERAKLAPLATHITRALEGTRVGYHGFRFVSNSTFWGSLMACPIANQLGQTIGAFVHIEDLTYVEQVLSALDVVAKAHDRQSALTSVLDACRILGHQWARLYLLSQQDPELLESHVQFGEADNDIVLKFEKHGYRFGRSDRHSQHAWRSMDEGELLVFSYKTNNQTFLTLNGLLVHGTNQPGPPPFAKDLDALWMIGPLIAGKKRLGCISLECKMDLLPEHFHFLKVFFRLIANLMDLHLSYEQTSNRLKNLEGDRVAKVSLALVSHNLATRVAGFSPLLSQYEDLESAAVPELADLNRLFRSGYEDVRSVLERAKNVFTNAPLDVKRVELFALVDEVLGGSLAGSVWKVSGDRPLLVDADELQMKSALKEVIKNSLDLANRGSITIAIATISGDRKGWIRITIRDQGAGVPTELKERIFDDFFTHRPGRDPGTGLGLALARRVIQLHGGRVYEDGEPGKGARFKMEFPQYQEIRANSEVTAE